MSKHRMDLSGAWSATPTPFTESLRVDKTSVKRMIEHHIRLKQKGIFIGGTCGEGPFLRHNQFHELTTAAIEANNGRMIVAVQVTDNSYNRVLDNVEAAKAAGADIAVVAEPWFTGPVRDENIARYYQEISERSKLPVGIYSRGGKDVSIRLYRKILDHPNVCMFKDSSCNNELMQIALSSSRKRNSLILMTGYELGMVPYLEAGYKGILAGGGILIGALTVKMIEAALRNDFNEARHLQRHCDRINYAAYGGRKIKSWLTGLKYTLIRMNIFNTTAGYLQYPLLTATMKKIDGMIEKEKDILFPSG